MAGDINSLNLLVTTIKSFNYFIHFLSLEKVAREQERSSNMFTRTLFLPLFETLLLIKTY